MHTIYMLEVRGALRRHNNYKMEWNRNEYPHCHSNQISLCLDFLVRKFQYDFVVPIFSEKFILHIRLRNDEAFRVQ